MPVKGGYEVEALLLHIIVTSTKNGIIELILEFVVCVCVTVSACARV